MLVRLRRGVTFANVCSLLALLIAVSTGGAYAANTVFSTDIVNGEVKTVDQEGASVTSAKLMNLAVNEADLADDAVTNPKIAGSAVSVPEIATNGVAASEIADNSIDGGEIVDNSMTATDLGTDSVAGLEIDDGSVTATDLGTDSVGTSEIDDATVSGTDVASSTLTGADVATDSLTASDIAGGEALGTISVTGGSVPDGGCIDLTLATPGTEVDEAVLISMRAALPAGVLVYGLRVPLDDQTLAKVCNFTGGASPEIDHVPIHLITFD